MKASSARQKGKQLEDHIADQIVLLGIDPKARRDGGSGSGNREKGDIITSMMVLGQNAGIEAKNQKTLCIPEWWRQTKKLEKLGREPILAFKQFGEPMEETKVIVYLDTFLRLIKLAEGKTEAPAQIPITSEDREFKWRVENAKRVLAELAKYL